MKTFPFSPTLCFRLVPWKRPVFNLKEAIGKSSQKKVRRAKDWALAGILQPLTTMQSCSNNTCLLVQVFTYVAVYFDEECCMQICSKKFGCHVIVSSFGVRPSSPQANQCEVPLQIFPVLYKTFGGGQLEGVAWPFTLS